MELEWSSHIPGRVLLLAPLAVSYQIEAEARRFGYDAAVSDGGPSGAHVTITNYEKIHNFDPLDFSGVVLDESSILKAYDGKTRTRILDTFRDHDYKLAATATPSPNDFMELGNHSEFLGAMTRQEMLAMFFVHDGGSTQSWRLKGHAVEDFWHWVGSWSCMVRSPSDLGFDNDGFSLPDLRIHHVPVDCPIISTGALIPGVAGMDLRERRRVRRESISHRVEAARAIHSNGSPFLFWCDLNDESTALSKAIPGAVEVRGSDTDEHKRGSLLGFAVGEIPALVTKPKIGGWGMNWQACHRMAFVGLSDSYEAYYQAIRRCWRFGQKNPVDVYLIYSEAERAVVENVLRKEANHRTMQDAMAEVMNA